MLEEYTPLVHQIVGGFLKRLPRNILREDLLAAGMGGLWDAIHRHPDGGDESFEWYVRVRVRGAILDELRAQDWLPRRARETAKTDKTTLPAVVRYDDLSADEQRSLFGYDINVDELLDCSRRLRQLLVHVDDLPTRERYIITEHYFRDVRLKDLAVELGISAPRVSQLHARALTHLRDLAKLTER